MYKLSLKSTQGVHPLNLKSIQPFLQQLLQNKNEENWKRYFGSISIYFFFSMVICYHKI